MVLGEKDNFQYNFHIDPMHVGYRECQGYEPHACSAWHGWLFAALFSPLIYGGALGRP